MVKFFTALAIENNNRFGFPIFIINLHTMFHYNIMYNMNNSTTTTLSPTNNNDDIDESKIYILYVNLNQDLQSKEDIT